MKPNDPEGGKGEMETETVQWRIEPGLTPYPEALAFMEARVAAIREGHAREMFWLVEHPPLYTAGTSAAPNELLGGTRFPVFEAGRGGRFTYHGPGQRVVYVMVDLKRDGGDLRRHVQRLEELAIRTLAEFGVAGERRSDRIGVWVRDADGREAKIAALGVRVRRWVAFHGLSINVHPDLEHFAGIVPCGIAGFGVTSLQALGIGIGLAELDRHLFVHAGAVFDRQFVAGQEPDTPLSGAVAGPMLDG